MSATGGESKGGKKKTRRNPIPKRLRERVWREAFTVGGPDGAPLCPIDGACWACGAPISFARGWHCGHVIADAVGGPTSAANLRPLCQRCNLAMSAMSMYEFVLTHCRGRCAAGFANLKAEAKAHPKKIRAAIDLAELVELSERRLAAAAGAGAISKTAAKKILARVESKRARSLAARVAGMEKAREVWREAGRPPIQGGPEGLLVDRA